jgi:hypothetical protein
MLTWAEHQDEYLDEFLHLEGRGYTNIYSTCGGCGNADPTYRCAQQMCYGPSLYCKKCIISRHAALPTHWIQVRDIYFSWGRLTNYLQEWNGSFFVRQTLKSLGLVIQLGHPVGTGCNNPVKAIVTFTVIDLTGIHNVDANFCNCDSKIERWQQLMRVCWWPATARDPQTCATFGVLRLFQILNCLSKVSAHDFLWSLELLTNNDGLDPPPVGFSVDVNLSC